MTETDKWVTLYALLEILQAGLKFLMNPILSHQRTLFFALTKLRTDGEIGVAGIYVKRKFARPNHR
jgi:hypothetical protein